MLKFILILLFNTVKNRNDDCIHINLFKYSFRFANNIMSILSYRISSIERMDRIHAGKKLSRSE